MIAILADENNLGLGRKLYEGFLGKNIEAEYISVENVDVKPCYGCGGCVNKTYGKCIVRDDGDWIYPKLVCADTLILVTPITFGSYSFKLKRVYDKCAVIGDGHYKVANNELAKGGIARITHIYAVGYKDNCGSDEKAAFEALVRENLIITRAKGKAYIVNSDINNAQDKSNGRGDEYMKKAVIINLSPRQKGTSHVLAGLCQKYLEEHNHQVDYLDLYANLEKMDHLYQSIDHADSIIMSGPSYINCYPADTIVLLQGILAHKNILHGQNLYGIIQGGMPYAHTHVSGIRTLELFCKEAGIPFKGGFVIGLGAMLNGQPLDKLVNAKKVKKQFDLFLNYIEQGEVSPNSVYEKSILRPPGLVCRIMAVGMNKKINKKLKDRGIDIKQLSPYLQK